MQNNLKDANLSLLYTSSGETNPCAEGQKPAVEPRTFTLFTCKQDHSQICPSGFYCTGYNSNNEGVCCAEADSMIQACIFLSCARVTQLISDPFAVGGVDNVISSSNDLVTCTHGDPFSNAPDGAPLKCSLSVNTCPSTHYCSSKPGDAEGICCVTKRAHIFLFFASLKQ